MTIRARRHARLAAAALVVCWPALAAAQTYYPLRGQDAKQQQQTCENCARWAVETSGYDPRTGQATAPPPGAPQSRVVGSGAMVRGAVPGAAVGAVGGAIGGDAGKGAAIGAGVGALFGGLRRASEVQAERQAYADERAQHERVLANGPANYEQAFRSCMASYGYGVR
jgi:hypothetical protein